MQILTSLIGDWGGWGGESKAKYNCSLPLGVTKVQIQTSSLTDLMVYTTRSAKDKRLCAALQWARTEIFTVTDLWSISQGVLKIQVMTRFWDQKLAGTDLGSTPQGVLKIKLMSSFAVVGTKCSLAQTCGQCHEGC